jgi:hypothetical protein
MMQQSIRQRTAVANGSAATLSQEQHGGHGWLPVTPPQVLRRLLLLLWLLLLHVLLLLLLLLLLHTARGLGGRALSKSAVTASQGDIMQAPPLPAAGLGLYAPL